MQTNFFALGVIMLLAVMSPGPDFAIVTKNSLLGSRKAGIYTALGVAVATSVHATYCILGLAVFIREFSWLFHTLQYLGAAYLIYLGVQLLKSRPINAINSAEFNVEHNKMLAKTAFKQGFMCNLLNPKAALFFLTLFGTLTIHQSFLYNFFYTVEMVLIAVAWFCFLSYSLSHPLIVSWLNRSIQSIERILGILLIGLGLFVALEGLF